MKKVAISLLGLFSLTSLAFAGSDYSGKEVTQTAAQPQECWYADTEWDVGLWGAYAFSGTDNNRSGIVDTNDLNIFGSYDRFLSADHAWGGGLDAKYFFHKYFGIGIEGFALDGHTLHAELDHGSLAVPDAFYQVEHHPVGGVLGTFTLRYPIGCSRFAPYAFAGGGGIFNGRDDRAVGHDPVAPSFADHFARGDESHGMGQFGAGMEVRVTRHIGWTTDFSWNVVDGPHNNFGMVRSGLNFAF